MENLFTNGALKSGYDLRDDWFEPLGRGEIDWNYNIEDVIGKKLVTKNQGKSGSCGGQAWSYYGEVLEAIATKSYEPLSARWIYSHTRHPNGGSSGRANSDFVIKKGYAREVDAPSYDEGKAPDEYFMTKVPVLSDNAEEIRDVSRVASYMKVIPNFSAIGEAVKVNHGVIIRIGGQDNGTWRTRYPAIPKTESWWHWLYVGKLREKDGKRYLGVKNSWGDIGDDGWQWLSEDWIAHISDVYTLSWDYKRPLLKKALQAQIPLLKEVVRLMNQLINLKK